MMDVTPVKDAVGSMDLIAPWIVNDIRPLLAFLVPWVGMIGIIWAGEKRPNLRDFYFYSRYCSGNHCLLHDSLGFEWGDH